MTILSLFDGMSCGQIALRELGVPITKYYASEIDRHATATSFLNFPEMVHLGDVEQWQSWRLDWASIDLVLAGSPCQGFSFAGKQLAFDDPRSRLFWVFVDILRHCQKLNPSVRFLLENVRMKPEFERVISDTLGIQPVVINSALVSAQNRVRLYWSNIRTRQEGLFAEWVTDIPQPEDRSITIQSIMEDEVPEKYYISSGVLGRDKVEKSIAKRVGRTSSPYTKSSKEVIKLNRQLCPKAQQEKASCLTAGGHSGGNHSDMDILAIRVGTYRTHKRDWGFRPMQSDKAPCLTARAREDGSGQACIIQRTRGYNAGGVFGYKAPCLTSQSWEHNHSLSDGYRLRRLTPRECCRLQTVPEWYRWECSDSQIYKMLGNGWTVEVIKHILKYIKLQ